MSQIVSLFMFSCGAYCLWSHNAGECVFSEYRKI